MIGPQEQTLTVYRRTNMSRIVLRSGVNGTVIAGFRYSSH